MIASPGGPTCYQSHTDYDYVIMSPLLTSFANQPVVLEAPCWPHAAVSMSLSRLRSGQVIFKHRPFLKTELHPIGPRQAIPEIPFSWKVGEEEPANFEDGFKEWLGILESQLCKFSDLDPFSVQNKLGRAMGPKVIPTTLCREQAKQRYLQASPASRDLGSLAVLCGCLLRWPPSRRNLVDFVKQLARLHVFDVDLKKAQHDLADFFDNSALLLFLNRIPRQHSRS